MKAGKSQQSRDREERAVTCKLNGGTSVQAARLLTRAALPVPASNRPRPSAVASARPAQRGEWKIPRGRYRNRHRHRLSEYFEQWLVPMTLISDGDYDTDPDSDPEPRTTARLNGRAFQCHTAKGHSFRLK